MGSHTYMELSGSSYSEVHNPLLELAWDVLTRNMNHAGMAFCWYKSLAFI